MQAKASNNGPRARPSRQQPGVSCRSCRSRKLRCNRELPCSNCVSRGIPCQRPEARRSAAATSTSVHSQETPGRDDQAASQPDILQRLASLENLLAQHVERRPQSTCTSTDPQKQQVVAPLAPADESDSTFTTSPLSLLKPQPDHPSASHYVSWIEQMYTAQESLRPSSDIGLSFKIVPIHGNEDHSQSYTGYARHPSNLSICIWLPTHSEAQTLLEKYVADISHFYHIVHLPTLRAIFRKVYELREAPDRLQKGQVLLVLSVLSAAAYFWTESDCEHNVLSTEQVNKASSFWMPAALHLIHSCYTLGKASLEALQGVIILATVVGALEGPSHRHRCLHNQGLAMAKDLELHTSDHPQRPMTGDRVQAEIKRRIWWYLATTDWLLSAVPNTEYEGTYNVNPRQMIVNQPLNVNDDDISAGADIMDRPLNQATGMSYFIQRVRLAEIARNLVDRSPLASASLGPPSYGDVLEADIELDRFINALPWFFRPRRSHPARSSTSMASDPSLAVQRYFINSHAQCHRCRLHLPYLSRGFTDPTYSYSRTTCLAAARLVVEADLELEEEKVSFVQTRIKSAGHLYGMFIASMALVMDLCLRGVAAQQELQQGPATHALRTLRDAGHHSKVAAVLHQSLTRALENNGFMPSQFIENPTQRARVGLGSKSSESDGQGASGMCASPGVLPHGRTSTMELGPAEFPSFNKFRGGSDSNMPFVSHAESTDMAAYFGELAQSLGPSGDFENIDWGAMLASFT